jgi:16S rRNA (guanine527-N7)-methyltransferase
MAARNASLSISGPTDFAEAFNVPRETIHRLERFADLLAHWQKRTNLVAPSTLTTLAPKARLWLDLGTGAGFPGLVIAILKTGTPNFCMHLVESNRKKCAFLAEVARATRAPVDIHAMRVEDLAESPNRLAPDVVSARALAPLPRLFELAAPFFVADTRGLFLKGREAEAEVEAAEAEWDFTARLVPSLTAANSHIVEVTSLRRRVGSEAGSR